METSSRPSTVGEVSSASVDARALHELVADVQRGNRPAAERLVREHDSWLRSVIYGVVGRVELVDDIAQQVWMQVWERLDSLKDPSRLRPWLCSVARNAAIDASMAWKRRASRTATLENASVQAPDQRSPSPVHSAIGGELRATLLRAVESLPVIYREPFALRHLEGWSYAEIGDVLELPVETVETRLVRARRLLRELLSGKVDV
jgi:RNA polymerase sigma factor (sigma-70 family)